MRRQWEAVQAVPDTAGEAMVATTGLEQAARREEEDGEARGPTVVAGELQWAVVTVFFLPPFGRHNVPTKGVFFLFCSTNGGYFSLPCIIKEKKMKKK